MFWVDWQKKWKSKTRAMEAPNFKREAPEIVGSGEEIMAS